MKIFGIEIETKKELRTRNVELMCDIEDLLDEREAMRETFPFMLGQIVYDIALKNDKGRYTKTKPSFEYSTITPVTVDEKNYFNLVKRYRQNDVFTDKVCAEAFLKSICK
jgi:hypothetical protein